MRNMFALLGALIVGVGVLGWYLGWYKVNVTKNSDGNLQINTDVDTKKVNGDSTTFFQKVGQMVEQSKDGGQNGTAPANTTPAPAAQNGSPTSTPLQGSLPSIPKPPAPCGEEEIRQ